MTKSFLLSLLIVIGPFARAADDNAGKPLVVDASTGWGQKITDSGWQIWHTQDGGRHWTDVSPPGLSGGAEKPRAGHRDARPAPAATLSAIDPQRAWVAIIPAEESVVRLDATADAGQHWKETITPVVADTAHISFPDGRLGFLLALGDPAAGLMMKKVYGTRDGGEHWAELSPPPAVSCYPTGISFRSPRDGWITATYHGGDDAPLYRTGDGGKTWQLQKLDLPAEYRGGYANTYPPVFAGADKKKGWLPVELVRHDPKPGHFAWLNYETEDGGETWHLPATGVPSVLEE
jgi:photosystem II stability/assembly factor-like uncharacterized protein